MDEIERMLAERACMQLMVDYNLYIDSHQISAFLSLWTEDCTFARVVPKPGYEVHGHAGLQSAMGRIIIDADRVRRHLLANPKVEILGPDAATGFCIGLAVAGPEGKSALPVPLAGVELVGEYRDVYRRTPHGWKIARRELTRVIEGEV